MLLQFESKNGGKHHITFKWVKSSVEEFIAIIRRTQTNFFFDNEPKRNYFPNVKLLVRQDRQSICFFYGISVKEFLSYSVFNLIIDRL